MARLDRKVETVNNLYKIIRARGVIYALGLCIGILARLSRSDLALFREIEIRAKDQL